MDQGQQFPSGEYQRVSERTVPYGEIVRDSQIPDPITPSTGRSTAGLSFNYQYLDKNLLSGKRIKRPSHHIVARNEEGEHIGSLTWKTRTGEIENIDVHPHMQRLGVATAMYEHAKKLSDSTGAIAPKHSSARTPSGDAWAQSTGDSVPKRKWWR